jgi:hypothetical protein
MIDSQTLGYIVSKLDERRTELEQFIGRGQLADYSEYHKLCGVIQGLDYAKQIVTDLAKRLEQDDDE